MRTKLVSCALVLSLSFAAGASSAHAEEQKTATGPDARVTIESTAFEMKSEGTYLTPSYEAPLPYDELIYSWEASLDEGEGFRLYLKVQFQEAADSPWLYGGYWGDVELVESRENPRFEHGYIAMDQLLLGKKARGFQFKVVDAGPEKLDTRPRLHVIVTDNDQVDEELAAADAGRTPILDLPYRAQANSLGEPMPDRCQTAALATALEYYGDNVPMEEIEPMTWDPEYNYPGIWPRTLGAASQLGYEGYIDRFRTWNRVKETLEENKVILVSLSMPEAPGYIAPPYESIGGHIVALKGLTEDGRVIVTDSALKAEKGARSQWLKEDFERVWMKNKGGVGMVIVPPKGAEMKTVSEIAEFPEEQKQNGSGNS